jgi:hypothetical protein
MENLTVVFSRRMPYFKTNVNIFNKSQNSDIASEVILARTLNPLHEGLSTKVEIARRAVALEGTRARSEYLWVKTWLIDISAVVGGGERVWSRRG